MYRKILGLWTALVVLGALALMPAGSTAATLTDTTAGGVIDKVEAGKKFVAEGTGTIILTSAVSALNFECNENVLTGSIHRNSGGIIEWTLEDAWFQGNYFAGDAHTPCRNNLGQKVFVRTNLTNDGTTVSRRVVDKDGVTNLATHWCIVGNAETDNFVINPRNCTGAGGVFRVSIHVGGLICGIKREASSAGTISTSNTHSSVAEMTMVSEQEFVTDSTVKEHSGFCPATSRLDNFLFALYTDTDTTPTTGIHPVPINKTDPLYISSP